MTFDFQRGPVLGSVDSLYINGFLIDSIPEPDAFKLLTFSALLVGCELVRRRKSRCKYRLPG